MRLDHHKGRLWDIFYKKKEKGETFRFEDLYQFSKISLKKKRNRKKFSKDYHRYVSGHILSQYFGLNIFDTMNKIASQTIGLDLVAIEPSNSPTIQLGYYDFKYQDKDQEPTNETL